MNYKIVLVLERKIVRFKETISVAANISKRVEQFLKDTIKTFTNGELDGAGESENYLVEVTKDTTQEGVIFKYSIVEIKHIERPMLVKI